MPRLHAIGFDKVGNYLFECCSFERGLYSLALQADVL